MESLYIYAQSDASTLVYPENNTLRFIIKLPKRLRLHGNWSCALCEVNLPPLVVTSRDTRAAYIQVYLCTTLCSDSAVNGTFSPMLRRLILNDREQRKGLNVQFQSLFYIPVIQKDPSIQIQ